MEWTEDFSVQISEIDDQHRRWIEIMNEMHETLIKGDVQKVQNITEKILKDMQDYTRFHFTTEEDFLKKIGFPELAQHKKQHSKFYVQVHELLKDVQEEKMVLNTEIMKTMSSWFLNHILVEDMKYSRFVASCPAGDTSTVE
ncbi:MAG: bacteriohemerythrin [Proteobacteria bacterium]|nr:bacteriohemerythrin [Pseudomonadota bacterium]MBU1686424.1 bacteriohemerythrin [Pseudomonadota bacterium]